MDARSQHRWSRDVPRRLHSRPNYQQYDDSNAENTTNHPPRSNEHVGHTADRQTYIMRWNLASRLRTLCPTGGGCPSRGIDTIHPRLMAAVALGAQCPSAQSGSRCCCVRSALVDDVDAPLDVSAQGALLDKRRALWIHVVSCTYFVERQVSNMYQTPIPQINTVNVAHTMYHRMLHAVCLTLLQGEKK